MPQPVYSFNVAQVGDTYQFTYKKARFGLKQVWPYVLIVVVLSVILTKATGGNGMFTLLLVLVFAGMPIGLMNLLRRGGAFSISKDAITINGQSYDRKHINEMYIKEPRQPVETTTIRVGRPTFSGGSQQLSQDIGRSIHRQVAKNSWQIGFRYGEKNVKLASGLREDTAEVLYKRVLDVLGDYE